MGEGNSTWGQAGNVGVLLGRVPESCLFIFVTPWPLTENACNEQTTLPLKGALAAQR